MKSVAHATLAGVMLAFFIPLKADADGHSPVRALEHDMHGAVYFIILPLFAFANAGIDLRGFHVAAIGGIWCCGGRHLPPNKYGDTILVFV